MLIVHFEILTEIYGNADQLGGGWELSRKDPPVAYKGLLDLMDQ